MKLDKETRLMMKNAVVAMQSANDRFTRFGSANNGFETLEKALGYPDTLSYSDYLTRYRKQDIAHRVIKSPVALTWSQDPEISQSDTEETPFEEEWLRLEEDLSLLYKFSKADLLGQIGHYSALYLGMTDSTDISVEASPGADITYVRPLSEGTITVASWDTDLSSPRYGSPLFYDVELESGDGQGVTRIIHWSRVVHIANNTVENEYVGIPALRPIYNRLIGLEKLASGSPEMYWRGARPGYVASTKENILASAKTIEDFKTAISEFVNDLNRYLYAEDLDVKSLAPQVVSPKEHIDAQIELISAATRIPKRILVGSERGELSSDQDERAWLTYIEERRETVASKLIIRPFIDRMIALGKLPTPAGGYIVRWEPLVVMSEKEKAETSRLYADAIKKYDEALTVRDFIPPEVFAKYVLKFGEEVLAKMELGVVERIEREEQGTE